MTPGQFLHIGLVGCSRTKVDSTLPARQLYVSPLFRAASTYAERISSKGDELMQMREDWMESARDYVRENPLQALGIALAAGYLLHMITRR